MVICSRKEEMGGSFSYFRQSSRPQRLPNEDPDDQNAGLATSFIELMKPKCLWVDEEKDMMQLHPQEKQQQINKTTERTLEEFLSACPSLNKNYMLSDGGEYYVLKSFSSPKFHVRSSFHGGKADYNLPTNSLERLLKSR